ncbi:hypothetical protein ACFX2C_008819 [Malus domestica]
MQRGFIKEGFLKLYQNQGTGQEVAVLGEGTKMTTDTVITGGEVAVGVGIGMTVTDTMVGTETTVDEAGAVVPVLITTGAGEGGAMMMKGGVRLHIGVRVRVHIGVVVGVHIGLLIVPPLLGVALVLGRALPH